MWKWYKLGERFLYGVNKGGYRNKFIIEKEKDEFSFVIVWYLYVILGGVSILYKEELVIW